MRLEAKSGEVFLVSLVFLFMALKYRLADIT